ncbi:rod shape-determining protein MreC [Neisseriaceae bacterium ESL0693]|nr:rod shape-determining protein MreC [Neisseriaceae bacterium ESL0693]
MAEPSLHFVQNGLRPTSKLVLCSLAAIALLLLDHRYDAIERGRTYIAATLYPLQWLAKQPINLTSEVTGYFQNQTRLLHENQTLKAQNTQLKLSLQQQQIQLQSAAQVMQQARLQQQALPQSQIAQIISSNSNPLSDRFIINKGSHDHVQAGDPVSDEKGVIGQVSSVQPFSAEVTLITSNNIAIPAMVMRTGVRTLVYGRSGGLDLRFFPANSSLQKGDLLVTSGLDSAYPTGIPIAMVEMAQSGSGSPYYRAQISPVASVRSSNFVLVIPQKKNRTAAIISPVPDK